MSQHPNSERNFVEREDQDYPRTDRPGQQRPSSDREARSNPHNEQDLHYESPTKYDMDYYQRKVNRLENQLGTVEEELSLTKFKLQKAEDFERKYEELFKLHQDLNEKFDENKEQLVLKSRESSDLRSKLDEANFTINKLQSDVEGQKNSAQQIKKRKDEDHKRFSNQGAEERAEVERNFLRQIDNIRAEARAKQDKLKKEVAELQYLVASKENSESALKSKLERIKNEKNEEINKLKINLNDIKTQLSQSNQRNDEKVINQRTQLIEETQSRISNVRSLTLDIENTLMEEIKNLNEIVAKKDAEIAFLIEADKRQLKQNEETQSNLKAHIRRLQDKIFVIQRQNQIELFTTIDRLKKQYQENIDELNNNFDQIKQGHREQVKDLNDEIKGLRKELEAMTKEAKGWEDSHKQLSADKELAVKMLSQKIISLEKLKDEDLRNYTTSMRNIQEDAKNKLEDLHAAVQSKNNEFQIMTSQINLKNEEINTLLQDIQKLRGENREKIRSLETTNALEQNSLNELITSYKKEIMQLKRRVHELQAEMSDSISQYKLKNQLLKQDLNNQKEANELLRGRNQFLVAWCKQLESNLKVERISNVDVLHDHTVSRRETVQMREKVRVELQAIKDREVQQIANVFKLEKGRLESDLIKRQQELNALRAENSRLLSEYKSLERKVGKPSKLDKGSEEEGKCRATLEAEILLTENIFNAINRP